MTLAYACVAIAAAMPYALTGIAKGGGKKFDNARPREWLEEQVGWRKRAHWAHLNSFEGFPAFAAAVLVAHATAAPQGRVDAMASSYIAVRVVYSCLYIGNVERLRSIVWSIGTLLIFGLFFASLW